jgi:hypothetical protein
MKNQESLTLKRCFGNKEWNVRDESEEKIFDYLLRLPTL